MLLLAATLLLDSIAAMPAWQGRVDMTADSPSVDADTSVSYEVRATSAPADSLVGAEYVVTWPTDHIEAYAQGSLYARPGSSLMVELHPDSATMARRGGRPLAADLMCSEIVPQSLANQLRRQISSGEFTVESQSDSNLTLASNSTSRRVAIEIPGSRFDGRATVTVTTGGNFPTTTRYQWIPDSAISNAPLTFENILEENQRVFNRYNPRFITPASLVGTPMPDFRLRSLEGDRFEWRSDSPHRVTTLIALLNDAEGITRVREKAAETDGGNCDIIYIFTANNPEEVSEWGITTRANERILLRGNDLLRATGRPSLPAIFIVDTGGIVRSILL